MSEVYNPESEAYERLEALEVEAREIRAKLASVSNQGGRQVIERQLREVEGQIAALRRRLKP